MSATGTCTDPELVNRILSHLKAQGIFDQFRRECLADVDTKPAFQNLRQRVENFVDKQLSGIQWHPGLNKTQLRNMLRQDINSSGILTTGVDHIVNQVVSSKMYGVFLPKIQCVVDEFLGCAPSTGVGPEPPPPPSIYDEYPPPPPAPPVPPPPPDEPTAGSDDDRSTTPLEDERDEPMETTRDTISSRRHSFTGVASDSDSETSELGARIKACMSPCGDGDERARSGFESHRFSFDSSGFEGRFLPPKEELCADLRAFFPPGMDGDNTNDADNDDEDHELAVPQARREDDSGIDESTASSSAAPILQRVRLPDESASPMSDVEGALAALLGEDGEDAASRNSSTKSEPKPVPGSSKAESVDDGAGKKSFASSASSSPTAESKKLTSGSSRDRGSSHHHSSKSSSHRDRGSHRSSTSSSKKEVKSHHKLEKRHTDGKSSSFLEKPHEKHSDREHISRKSEETHSKRADKKHEKTDPPDTVIGDSPALSLSDSNSTLGVGMDTNPKNGLLNDQDVVSLDTPDQPNVEISANTAEGSDTGTVDKQVDIDNEKTQELETENCSGETGDSDGGHKANDCKPAKQPVLEATSNEDAPDTVIPSQSSAEPKRAPHDIESMGVEGELPSTSTDERDNNSNGNVADAPGVNDVGPEQMLETAAGNGSPPPENTEDNQRRHNLEGGETADSDREDTDPKHGDDVSDVHGSQEADSDVEPQAAVAATAASVPAVSPRGHESYLPLKKRKISDVHVSSVEENEQLGDSEPSEGSQPESKRQRRANPRYPSSREPEPSEEDDDQVPSSDSDVSADSSMAIFQRKLRRSSPSSSESSTNPSIAGDATTVELEKRGRQAPKRGRTKTHHQRYDSSDLYKPRPVIGGGSRRSRAAANLIEEQASRMSRPRNSSTESDSEGRIMRGRGRGAKRARR